MTEQPNHENEEFDLRPDQQEPSAPTNADLLQGLYDAKAEAKKSMITIQSAVDILTELMLDDEYSIESRVLTKETLQVLKANVAKISNVLDSYDEIENTFLGIIQPE